MEKSWIHGGVNKCHFCNQGIIVPKAKVGFSALLTSLVLSSLRFWLGGIFIFIFFFTSSLMHLRRFKNTFYLSLKKIIYHVFSGRINQAPTLPYCLTDILMSFSVSAPVWLSSSLFSSWRLYSNASVMLFDFFDYLSSPRQSSRF